ncbi:MAG: DUF1015 domain-containing protein [Actinomycetota bacterium]|nr:DUF1015 domain-containing protein [Actinomycetota bacterium]
MADVQPFRAVRYDVGKAGPLEHLVAPPYDVISPAEREHYQARSPHNVVHLTLPDSEDEAAGRWRDWQTEGVVVRDEEPSCWGLTQDYVGPDGVARTRTGLVCALRAEPYEAGVVLPHERTHRGPKEGRLRLLRALRAHVEPIFLLYDGPAPFSVRDGAPDVDVEGNRLWRLDEGAIGDVFADGRLLIADGHHRYETALAFHAEDGTPESAYLLAVLVSTSDPGVTIFPTHRVFARSPDGRWDGSRERDPETALRKLAELPSERAAAVQYAHGETVLATGDEGILDVQLVDRLGHEGIAYTPDWREAVRRVDAGEADVAYLVRPPRIEQVFAAAARGEVLPQKTTYFYPKLLSGLLFLPL